MSGQPLIRPLKLALANGDDVTADFYAPGE